MKTDVIFTLLINDWSFLWFDKQLERNVTGMWAAVSWGGALHDETEMAVRETTKGLVVPLVSVSIALTYFYLTQREKRAKRTSIACSFRQQISDIPDRQWPVTALRWIWPYIVKCTFNFMLWNSYSQTSLIRTPKGTEPIVHFTEVSIL